MLKVENLAVAYGKIVAVRDLTFEVPDGRMVAVLGRNGAGKTTAVKAICGLLPAKSGTVTLDGVRLDRLAAHKIVRQSVGLVPQGRELFPGLSVQDNLELGAYTVRDRARIREGLERAYHYFPVLKDRRAQLVGNLSGGEQQMVAVARALMTSPRLLILDEPSAGLAPKILRQVFEIVTDVSANEGTSVLVSEQNAREALRVASYVYVIETGSIVGQGTSEELRQDTRLMESYLGEVETPPQDDGAASTTTGPAGNL